MRSPIISLVICCAVGLATVASAQTTGEHGASLLIFPKVVADASGDTIVQVANLLETRVDVFCAYVAGDETWASTTSFTVSLIAEQPLHWVASRGRAASGEADPNAIPAAPADFRGELLCVEVDGTGAPSGGNRLVGRATVTTLADGDAFAYAAIGLPSLGFNDGDDVLCIGGEPSDDCFIGAEYSSCPAAWLLNHPSDGAPDEQLGEGATQDTRLIFVPCSQNVRDGIAGSVSVRLTVTNEFAQTFSASADVTCWADLTLADISESLTFATLGTVTAQTRLEPDNGSGGFVLLAESERRAASGGVLTRDALVPQQEGVAESSDAIILPMGRP